MKKVVSALLLATLASAAQAGEGDGFVMGPGQWSCAKALEVDANGPDVDAGLLAGWIMGYWSAVTFARDTSFKDTVETFGGKAIYDTTMAQCRDLVDPASVQLYFLTQAIIKNTK